MLSVLPARLLANALLISLLVSGCRTTDGTAKAALRIWEAV